MSILSAGEATALSFISRYRTSSPDKSRKVLQMLTGDARQIAVHMLSEPKKNSKKRIARQAKDSRPRAAAKAKKARASA